MRADDLTFVILTLNEAARITATLSSLPAGAVRYVLDAESADDTATLARAAGAQVEIRPWTDYCDARRYALRQVRTPWAFLLDADERPDAELLAAIAAAADDVRGYRCVRRTWFCGAPVRGGAWAGEQILRLVRPEAARIEGKNGGTLHETVSVPGPVPLLAGTLEHDSYPTLASYREKFARYTDIEAREFGPASLGALAAAVPPALARAAAHFLVRRGWRDGVRGVFIAGASALYPIVVRYKAWRRNHV